MPAATTIVRMPSGAMPSHTSHIRNDATSTTLAAATHLSCCRSMP